MGRHWRGHLFATSVKIYTYQLSPVGWKCWSLICQLSRLQGNFSRRLAFTYVGNVRRGGGYSHIWAKGDVPLNRVWFLPLWVWNRVYKPAFLSGTGYTLCPYFQLCNTVGARVTLLPARIALQTNIVAVSTHVPLHCILKHGISDSKVNCISHSGTGYLFSPFCLEQGSKIASV